MFATFGKCWQLLATYGSLWLLLANVGKEVVELVEVRKVSRVLGHEGLVWFDLQGTKSRKVSKSVSQSVSDKGRYTNTW